MYPRAIVSSIRKAAVARSPVLPYSLQERTSVYQQTRTGMGDQYFKGLYSVGGVLQGLRSWNTLRVTAAGISYTFIQIPPRYIYKISKTTQIVIAKNSVETLRQVVHIVLLSFLTFELFFGA